MRRGNSLVGVMVAVALLLMLVVVFMYGGFGPGGQTKSARPDGKGVTVPGMAKARAQDEVCRSNLTQIRQSLAIQSSMGENPVPDLKQTNLPDTMYVCPIGKEAYVYDASRGKVSCPHPGHEKF